LYVSVVVVVGSGLSTMQTQIGNSTLRPKKKTHTHKKFKTNLKMQIHVGNSTLRKKKTKTNRMLTLILK
jgi:hypothetical protein